MNYFRIIAVDLRRMGGSDKPTSGYDKKTMAQDIRELAQQLDYDKVNIVGHDTGSAVALSFATIIPKRQSNSLRWIFPTRLSFSPKLECYPNPESSERKLTMSIRVISGGLLFIR